MRLDVYSVAYEEANSELLEITKRFEQLRRRKETLEGLIAAISPILGLSAQANAGKEPAGGGAQPPADPAAYTFNQVPVPLADEDAGGDPFQRRVRNALKLGGSNQEHRGLQPAV